jgi:DNA-binding NarL/FixJ family response regulator/putative methionine-R-sulfoxide reductase with GAF domain
MTEPPAPGVLVVDDEPFFREAIHDALAEAGIACETVASGEEAVEAAENPGVGAVVLDLQLPGRAGLEVLRRIRASRPAVRVIVLSTHTDQELVLEALRVHACDYLAKPLHDEELVLSVRRALEGYAVEAGWASLRGRLASLETRMAELAELGRGNGPESRLEWIAATAAESAGEVLGASKTSLMLLDRKSGELRVVAATGRPLAPSEMDAVAVGEGVAGTALAGGELIVLDDVEEDARFAGRAPSDRYLAGSLAVVPLVGAEGPLGVLCATDREGESRFGQDEIAMLRILALQVGQLFWQAMEPEKAAASASDEVQPLAPEPDAPARESDAELARSICDALTQEVEPPRLIEAALRPVALVLPAVPVSLYLIDDGELGLEGQYDGGGAGDRARLPAGRGLTGTVLQAGQLVATDRPESDPRFDPEVDTPEGGEIGPLLCVPLRLRGKVLGVARAFLQAGSGASAATGEVLSAALSAAVRNVLLYRSLLESIDDVAEARREARD